MQAAQSAQAVAARRDTAHAPVATTAGRAGPRRRPLRLRRSSADVPRGSGGAQAISELVSGLVSEYIGHWPRARTYLNGDVLTVVVEDSLTAGEQRLVRDGMSELVLSTRRAFQRTMRQELIAGVEQLTGRRVRLSANQMEPDITVEVFVLDAASGAAAAPGGR